MTRYTRDRVLEAGTILFTAFVIGLLIGIVGIAVAHATPLAPTLEEQIDAVRVPDASAMYRRFVEQAASEVWGVDASPARLAAQIHQESSWRPRAHSGVGAEGLAQFMPDTARWIAQQFPDKLGDFDPWNPEQAAYAAALYDDWLLRRNPGASACASWAFALSAYNGGEARLHAEQALADKAGSDWRTWFGSVSRYRARSLSAWRQNRGYVRSILLILEPAYIDAGWAGKAVCA